MRVAQRFAVMFSMAFIFGVVGCDLPTMDDLLEMLDIEELDSEVIDDLQDEGPDADPADDGLASGLYKGTIVSEGNSGTVLLDIATDFSEGTCSLVLNEQEQISSNFSTSFDSFNQYRTFEFDVQIGRRVRLQVTPSGGVVGKSVISDSEFFDIAVMKESSTAAVDCYVGTATGFVGDVPWNFVVKEGTVEGHFPSDGGFVRFTGTVDAVGQMTFNWNGGASTGTGSIIDGAATGTYTTGSDSGQWSAAKAL